MKKKKNNKNKNKNKNKEDEEEDEDEDDEEDQNEDSHEHPFFQIIFGEVLSSVIPASGEFYTIHFGRPNFCNQFFDISSTFNADPTVLSGRLIHSPQSLFFFFFCVIDHQIGGIIIIPQDQGQLKFSIKSYLMFRNDTF